MDENLKNQLAVKAAYPDAYVIPEKSHANGMSYTCFDPQSRLFVGPTAFTPDNAWRWAADRLAKAQAAQ